MKGAILVMAALMTLLWAAVTGVYSAAGTPVAMLPQFLEVLKNTVWFFFLFKLLHAEDGLSWLSGQLRPFAILLALLCLLMLGIYLHALLTGHVARLVIDWNLAVLGNALLAVAGLVLTETLFRNTPQDQRWHIKFLCLATGGMFAYDLFLYADAMLFRQLDGDLVQARGVIQVLVAPLLAVASVRNRMWRSDIALSRQIVLHTTALIGSGGYLFLMAAAGFYLREMGGHWGPVFQAMFLVGAVGMLLVVLFSGTVRSYLRVFIDKHFFRDRYDYRTEWLRFMQTVASGQDSAALEERVVKAVADIVDSPGGAMWLCDVEIGRAHV